MLFSLVMFVIVFEGSVGMRLVVEENGSGVVDELVLRGGLTHERSVLPESKDLLQHGYLSLSQTPFHRVSEGQKTAGATDAC